MVDFSAIFKIKQYYQKFCSNHPKFPQFVDAVTKKPITEGVEISYSLSYPDGSKVSGGFVVKESDLDLLRSAGLIK